MFSEGSCDIADCNFQLCHHSNKLHSNKIYLILFDFWCCYSIFDQINAALVSIRDTN